MWIFEEKQQTAGFFWIIGFIVVISLASVFIPFLLIPEDISELKSVLSYVLIIDLLVIFILTYFFRFLIIKADEEKIHFGYGPFTLKIPYTEIKSARLVKYTFWKSGGLGIRLGRGGRWNYVAKIGPMIEIDWGKKKKHGFSVINHVELSQVLKDYLGDRFTIVPEFIQKKAE